MKFILMALIFLLSLPALAAERSFYVDGMTCPFCTYGVEKKLREIRGVSNVEFEVDKGKVTVTTRNDEKISNKQIEEAVKKAGFSVREFENGGQEKRK
jgi:copper chaperone CopZ